MARPLVGGLEAWLEAEGDTVPCVRPTRWVTREAPMIRRSTTLPSS
jgi:hypothetical protein